MITLKKNELFHAYCKCTIQWPEVKKMKLTLKDGTGFIGTPYMFDDMYFDDPLGDHVIFFETDENGDRYSDFCEEKIAAVEVLEDE